MVARAFLRPNGILNQLKVPKGVIKPVYFLLSSEISIYQNPDLMSSLVNIEYFPSKLKISSILGRG